MANIVCRICNAHNRATKLKMHFTLKPWRPKNIACRIPKVNAHVDNYPMQMSTTLITPINVDWKLWWVDYTMDYYILGVGWTYNIELTDSWDFRVMRPLFGAMSQDGAHDLGWRTPLLYFGRSNHKIYYMIIQSTISYAHFCFYEMPLHYFKWT